MTFTNYTLANITGLYSGFAYFNSVTGGLFTPLVLIGLFLIVMGALAIFTKERAIAIALFLTIIPCFLFVASGLLNPAWLLVNILAFAGSLFFLGRLQG